MALRGRALRAGTLGRVIAPQHVAAPRTREHGVAIGELLKTRRALLHRLLKLRNFHTAVSSARAAGWDRRRGAPHARRGTIADGSSGQLGDRVHEIRDVGGWLCDVTLETGVLS